ncbi:hypothetical protein UFOVP1367_25 [uncultured Caudovirales phage]|uniref:Uncharacterized protein n=1 Tax=uncultured Caudovirales phage TaxID=2100421 RepID=A0A6J5S2L6_9CAUD|nr:hypothetical protein KNT69_gp25 [uncultured Caudovirales phage]CAB4202587.1 hypothetical protein UFOVP1367_25 [uncultured Caudovirales phage]
MYEINELEDLLKIKENSENRFIRAKANHKPGTKVPTPRIDRSLKLIVPFVTFENGYGSLNNDNWAYAVTYAFRDALDIIYELKDEKTNPHMVWTQGCRLNFLVGDMLNHKDGGVSLQVVSSMPMGWTLDKTFTMGSVTYQSFIQTGLSDFITVSQFEFLAVLINGRAV